jgi:hypothetical protein
MMKTKALFAALAMLTLASAWGNGYAVHPDDNIFADSAMKWQKTYMYGTHDYLAEKAWEILREEAPEEAKWISQREFFYGTELPDSKGYKESINDPLAQYLEFDEDGNVVDNRLANRAMSKYDEAVAALERGAKGTASQWAGTVLSYVSNAGLFSRVLEEAENGYRFQQHVQWITKMVYPSEDFEEKYGEYIEYDGALEIISPYDATMRIGRGTYTGMKDGSCNASWMDKNYDIEGPDFIACAGRNFNNIVNAEVDVLHTIYQAANGLEYETYAYDWENTEELDRPEDDETETPKENKTTENETDVIVVPINETVDENDSQEEAPSVIEQEEEGPREESSSWMFYVIAVILIVAVVSMTYVNSRKAPKKKGGRKSNKKRAKKPKAKKK